MSKEDPDMEKIRKYILERSKNMTPEQRKKMNDLAAKYKREDEDELLKKLKVGDSLECIEDYNNTLGWPLCIEGQEYPVLAVNLEDRTVMVKHILYANEYVEWPISSITKHFRYARSFS
jgi:hypothetical protein